MLTAPSLATSTSPPGPPEPLPVRVFTARHLGRVTAPVVALGALAVWNPADNGGPALCPFHVITGLWCPGCGLTRAGGVLARGNIGDAIGWHPMILPLAIQVAVVWALFSFVPQRAERVFGPRVRTTMLMLNSVALIGVWVYRIRTGQIADLS